jgi:hypothetical protein
MRTGTLLLISSAGAPLVAQRKLGWQIKFATLPAASINHDALIISKIGKYFFRLNFGY